MKAKNERWASKPGWPNHLGRLATVAGLLWLTHGCQAALQFDVFIGYDGVVPEATWIPVTCEARNDGPGFVATVEVRKSDLGASQTERTVVELPTGTLKRFSIPVFSEARSFNSFDVRVWDERGKLRFEQTGLLPTRSAMGGTAVLGSVSRSGRAPELPRIQAQQPELQPCSAQLRPALLPDNPLLLEGLDCLYLNSERAADLNPAQANALMAWLDSGGHLVVAVEQSGDISASTWLKKVFPVELREIRAVEVGSELQDWLRQDWSGKPNSVSKGNNPYAGGQKSSRTGGSARLKLDELLDGAVFQGASVQVAVGQVRTGKVEISAGGTPLIVGAAHGRGFITALLFSPEREPVRSWKGLPLFWARLAGVPRDWFESADYARYGGYTSDAVFGAMIDSRQVHKLPLEWLLLLLLAYLVVIGPLDYFVLKKLRRPMLTWITFPSYILAFSGLIYVIGYKLRAGESEWNELHVVDVLTEGGRAELRGRTYASVYSPANARYLLEGAQRRATFRGEFASTWGGSQGVERTTVFHVGDTFKADVSVPVWTPQLFASDWVESGPAPLQLKITPAAAGWNVEVGNQTGQKLKDTRIVMGERVVSLGEVRANETRSFEVRKDQGPRLKDFVSQRTSQLQNAVQWRGHAFGRAEEMRLDDVTNSLVAVSFISQAARSGGYMNAYVAPPGLDLTSVVQRGNAVLLAWADDSAPTRPMYHFSPRRSHRSTFWRCTVPLP